MSAESKLRLKYNFFADMLEQRRAQEKGYITLKEAAKIADYSPDYIGQLIRSGKIRGEQVYANVAWVTTEEEIQSYLNDKGRVVSSEVVTPFFAHKLAKYILYVLIGLCGVFLIAMQYILFVSIDNGIERSYLSKTTEVSLSESI